ncbi:nitronate monooxygenase, partial [bacterium LRH843]|nr:nitronate monooxygenase [bacterium LRH843]
SNAGGLGQITAMTLKTKENLTREIHKVKALTSFPFGVNFAVGGQTGTSYEELLEVAITEQVPVVSITGANPAPIIEKLKGTSIKTLVLVSN